MDEIDLSKFATMLRQRRGNMGLREVAIEIGNITAPTLSRLEHRNMPDLETYVRVCRWLGVPLETFIFGIEIDDNAVEVCRRKVIQSHIHSDKTLTLPNANALSVMVDLVYKSEAT